MRTDNTTSSLCVYITHFMQDTTHNKFKYVNEHVMKPKQDYHMTTGYTNITRKYFKIEQHTKEFHEEDMRLT